MISCTDTKTKPITLQPHQKKAIDCLKRDSVHGLVLYHQMGMGKTITALKYILEQKSKQIVIFTPGLELEWITQMKQLNQFKKNYSELTSSRIVDFNGNVYTFYEYTQLDVYIDSLVNVMKPDETQKLYNKNKKEVIYVFDESHRLAKIFQENSIYTSVYLKLFTASYKTLLLTGTIIYRNVEDLLYCVNLAAGQYNDFVFPLTKQEFQHRYCKANALTGVIKGWLMPLVALRFGGYDIMRKVLDISDFYASKRKQYHNKKHALIVRMMPFLGLDSKVAGKTILDYKEMNIRQIISTMLYWFLYSPMENVLPIILAVTVANSYKKISKLNTKVLINELKPYVNYAGVGYEKQSATIKTLNKLKKIVTGNHSFSFKKNIPTGNFTHTLPTTYVYDATTSYSRHQYNMFIRASINRLTLRDRQLLGLNDVEDTSNINKYGLKIGNIVFTTEDITTINNQYRRLVDKRMKKLETIIANSSPLQNDNNDFPTRSLSDEENDTKFVDSQIPPKFRDIGKLLGKEKTVIYSTYLLHGLYLFYLYLVSIGKKSNMCWLLRESTVRSLPLDHPIVRYYDNIEGKTFTDKNHNILKLFSDNINITYCLLDPNFTEGVTIKNVAYMHILEPIDLPARKQQLLARVARVCSHRDSGSIVHIYIWKCTLKGLIQKILKPTAIKAWAQTEPLIIFFNRTKAFSQDITPDETTHKKSNQSNSFIKALQKGLM